MILFTLKVKQPLHDEIAAQTAAFLAKGGEIKSFAQGETGDRALLGVSDIARYNRAQA